MNPAPIPNDWWWTKSIKNIETPLTLAEYHQIQEKLSNEQLVIIFFYSKDNTDCELYMPRWSLLSQFYHDRVTFLQIDIENKFFFPLVKEMEIEALPTFKFVRDKQPFSSLVGGYYKVLEKKIRECLQLDTFDLFTVIIDESKSQKYETITPTKHPMRKTAVLEMREIAPNYSPNLVPSDPSDPIYPSSQEKKIPKYAKKEDEGQTNRRTPNSQENTRKLSPSRSGNPPQQKLPNPKMDPLRPSSSEMLLPIVKKTTNVPQRKTFGKKNLPQRKLPGKKQ